MKKRVKKNDRFSPAEVGALIENLRSQFKAFGEGLNDLKEKVDILTGMVAHEAENSTLSRLEIVNLKNVVTQINGKLARIEEEIRLIKNSLILKVDRKDLEILEKKVASLAD